MKTRFRSLTRAQQVVLLATVLLTLVFTVIYAVSIFKQGIWYCGGFLTYSQNQGTVTYSGHAEEARLTVTIEPDKTVTTQWGDVVHGPYTVREDPTALPPEAWDGMVGVEVREGTTVLFRGGWLSAGDTEVAMTSDGELHVPSPILYDHPPLRELDFQDILRLWSGPDLVRRANIGWYFPGLLLAVLGILILLFAEELFRWKLSWQINDPDSAEPSGWELGRRTLCAALFALLALVCWVMGLVNT